MASFLDLMRRNQQKTNVFAAAEASSAKNSDFPSSSSSELTCPICLEIFERPVTTRCGHTYCQGCLQECLSRPDPACAMCRSDLQHGGDDGDGGTEASWFEASDLQALIQSSSEPCRGCGSAVGLAHMKSHTDDCQPFQDYLREGVGRATQAQAAQRQSLLAQQPSAAALSAVPPPNRHTFACPYCALRNLDQEGLAEHCGAQHARDPRPVVCPVCASMPWGDPNYRSGNFLRHLRTRHNFAYDTFVDYAADEERMIQEALERSLAHQ